MRLETALLGKYAALSPRDPQKGSVNAG